MKKKSDRMTFQLRHLPTGWDVDQAILWHKDVLVAIRFGHDNDPTCMHMDELLAGCAEKLKKFVVIYVVDITEVPNFNELYELRDPCSLMFFFRNKIVQIDYGTGENNKMTFVPETKQEFIDICEIAYIGATKGSGVVKSLINYSGSLTKQKV